MVVAEPGHEVDKHKGEHEHHEHPPQLQHHFETEEQQFESSKLGMWLFLATEFLLFSGLFCAYVIFRAHHWEIYEYGHKYLDTTMGAINTAVLIFSSFTMAWGVRAAQLGKQKLLITLLAITVICGGIFMGIKYVEYTAKFEHGLMWGTEFDEELLRHYNEQHDGIAHGGEHGESAETAHEGQGAHASASKEGQAPTQSEEMANQTQSAAAGNEQNVAQGEQTQTEAQASPADDRTTQPVAAVGPVGLNENYQQPVERYSEEEIPQNLQVFFGIYFTMTGLHALHVIIGMIAITWLLVEAIRGKFGTQYYTPVDLVGLYWHVVDLIWIYLFPLLYLID